MVVAAVPLNEAFQPGSQRGGGFEPDIAAKVVHVGIGDRHIPVLHGQIFPDCRPPDQAFKYFDERGQFFGLVVAQVINSVGAIAGGRIRLVSAEGRVSFGPPVHDPINPLDDVVDVGEIPPHLAMVEDLDRNTFQDCLGEEVVGHVRSPPGSVNREEAQPGHRQAIEMAITVGQQFIGLLSSGIERHGMVDIIVHRKRKFTIRTINRTG